MAVIMFIENLQKELNYITTENNELTYKSSLSANVDFLYKFGNYYTLTKDDIINSFHKAYNEDIVIASKLLLYSRDIYEGLGVREVLRTVIANTDIYYFESFFEKIIELGSYKDIVDIYNRICFIPSMKNNADFIENFLIKKIKKNTTNLVYKWMPRNGRLFNMLSKKLNLKKKEFRKLLVEKSNTVEQKITCKNFSNIDYSQVPSLAFAKHYKTFMKFDEKRFNKFIQDVKNNKTKVNTKTLYPHDVARKIEKFMSKEDKDILNTLWNNLKDTIEVSTTFLPIIDVSGSMFVGNKIRPIDIAIGIGIYLAQHNKSQTFRNYVITFSENPSLYKLQYDNIVDTYNDFLENAEGLNTNIEKVYKTLLKTCINNQLKQSDLPEYLLIISDMQFDEIKDSDKTTIIKMKELYQEYGYKLPKIIFWNVNSSYSNIPSLKDEKDVILISGYSINIMKDILSNNFDNINSELFLLNIVNKDRYKI